MSKVVQVNFKKIQKHAKENRWSGLAIAREAGISASAVSQLFKGKVEPSAVNLYKVCDVIGLPIQEVFTTRRAA